MGGFLRESRILPYRIGCDQAAPPAVAAAGYAWQNQAASMSLVTTADSDSYAEIITLWLHVVAQLGK
jgi:hypothetical protein